MKVEIKDKSQVLQEVVITVDAETAMKDYTKCLKKVGNKVVIPGYRKGKAPLSRVEKDYESHAGEEFYRTYIDKYYQQALKDNEMHPISEPVPQNIEWEKDQEFILTLTYEVEPTIEIATYEGLEVPFAPIPISTQLNQYIDSLRNRAAVSVDVDEPIEKNDIIETTVTLADSDIKREFLIDDSLGEKFVNDALGKKIGDEFATELENRLIDKDAKNPEEMVAVKVSIDSVRRTQLPEVNDDFAKDFEYDNVEDMMAKLTEELSVDNEKSNRENRRSNMLNKISDANDFEVPEIMIENYSYHMAKPYIEAYNIEAEKLLPMFKENAKKEVKNYYVLKTLIDVVTSEITDEFREEVIARFAKEEKKSVDEYKETRNEMIKSDDFEEILKTENLYRWLEEKNTFIDPPVEETPASEETETTPEA
ncbi:MAG: trigger factor [Candidatus Zophobacter franzmannii]|nr:trigger factor [Candidatus Zophobacter franzmannii]